MYNNTYDYSGTGGGINADDVRPNARIHELTFDIPTVLVAGQSD